MRIIIGILEGVEAMHASGVVHRDLKPKNIMLGSEREVKIIDLGFASVPGMPDFTSGSDARFGHPIYSPPERTNGRGDQRTDIYSVGMMMYELMGGSSFRLLDCIRMLGAHIIPSIVAADAAVGLMSREAAEIIRNSLSKEPGERYQSAREMKEAIGSLCSV
jgi:serine/threonine-protein kinase